MPRMGEIEGRGSRPVIEQAGLAIWVPLQQEPPGVVAEVATEERSQQTAPAGPPPPGILGDDRRGPAALVRREQIEPVRADCVQIGDPDVRLAGRELQPAPTGRAVGDHEGRRYGVL